MLDRKLFVFSIISWFLALGLGILVGAAAGNRGILDSRLEQWLGEMEADMHRLRQEHRLLRESLDEKEGVLGALLEDAIKERLEGMTIAVVGAGDSLDRARWLLETAGAAVVDEAHRAEAVVVDGMRPDALTAGVAIVSLVKSTDQPLPAWTVDDRGQRWAAVVLDTPLDGLRLVRVLESLFVQDEGGYRHQEEK